MEEAGEEVKKLLFVAILAAGLSGCGEPEYSWGYGQHMCMTPEQKAQAADMAKTFMASTPSTLSGDDQDYEDAVNAAAEQAKEIACPLVYREYVVKDFMGYPEPTGRWKYAEEVTK